jgi:hypothetical protein
MTFQLSLDEAMTETRAAVQFLQKENASSYVGLFIMETYFGQVDALRTGLRLMICPAGTTLP